jgi:two-component system, chemotaxis family, sensor kinase CheA
LSAPKKHSLRAKLIALVLTSLTLVGLLTLGAVSFMQFRQAEAELAISQVGIRSALIAKGKMLCDNHALALKTLVADNAFNDVSKLVKDTVEQDKDVRYGLFLGPDRTPWVYARHDRLDAAKDAWKELGLAEAALASEEPSFRSRTLFGGEIFEFSAPIRVDDEYLGAIHYGISTARMTAALEQERQRSEAALARMLLVLLAAVFVASGIGLVMSARRATGIVKPLVTLTQAARAFAAGNKSATVEGIDCGDEVEDLANAYNGMVHDLNRSYASLEHLNRTLEQKVEERTAALGRRNRDMALVLDNIDQGLITVGKDGIMAKERSRAVTSWFGAYEEGARFVDYIAKVDASFATRFEMNFEALLADMLPRELSLDQMPKALSAKGRQYHIAYREILAEDRSLSGLLLVIMDVTDALARELEEAEQRGLLAVFSQLNRDRDGYLIFHRESSRIMSDLCSGRLAQDLSALKRCIHTLKGNAGSVGLSLISSLCHRLEDEIDETNAPPAGEALEALKARWNRISDTVCQLTQERSHGLEVREEDYQRLLTQLGQLDGGRELVQQVLSWQYEPVERPLRRLAERGAELAHKLGKGDVQLEVRADDIRLDTKRWEPLWTSLLHVVRNAVDHGFRAEAGASAASPPARLSVSARIVNERFVVCIADNGAGIDWERVRAKAAEQHLPCESREQLVQALLRDNFSTAETLSEVSGRGIGMAAVNEVVTSISGAIQVESEPGTGTAWSFSFPESMLNEDLEKLRGLPVTRPSQSRFKRAQPAASV